MKRYIDANKINFTGQIYTDDNEEVYIRLSDVKKVIEQTPPADVAEVVICKECKWWIGERCLNPNGAYNCVTGPYWFCKSGQRREKKYASNTEC